MSDFSIRVRRYTTPETRGRVIQGATLTFSDVGDEASVLSLTVPEAVAGALPTPFYAAVEVRGPQGWVRPRNDLFTFHRRAGNQKDPAAIKDLTGVQFVADRLGAHKLDPAAFGSGEVTWQAASAGGVLADFLTRTPGTGITRSFTPAKDSAGTTWPAEDVADQTAGQFASGKSILDALTAGAFCTWWSEGTELVLRKPGTGVRRNIRIDPPARDITVDEDTTETASKFYVVTDTSVPVQTVMRPELGAGPREAVVTVAGATTAAIALRMAKPIIDAAAKVRREITVNYDAANLPARPFIDFQVGDDFDVHHGVYRLVGIQVTKGDTVTVRLTFGEIFRTLAAKLAGRTASLTLGTGQSTVGRPLPSAGGEPAGKTDAPTLPMLRSSLAMIFVSSDGNLTSGKPGSGFAHFVIEAAPDEDGPWFQVGQDFTQGEAVFPASAVGVGLGGDVYVRLRAVNTKGVLSDPSEIAVVEVAGVGMPDVTGEIKDAIEEALQEAIAAGITADGRNRIFARLSVPESSLAPFVGGDLWYVLDPLDTSRFIAVRMWNGSQWKPYQIVADSVLVPGSVGGTLIKDGVVTSSKLQAEEIWGNTAWLDQAVITMLTAGRIQTHMLSVGTKLSEGTPVNRVPALLTDAAYWASVVDGTVKLGGTSGLTRQNVAATVTGVLLSPTSTLNARLQVTATLPLPTTRKLYVKWATTGTPLRVVAYWRNDAGFMNTSEVSGSSGEYQFAAPDGATTYDISVIVDAGGSPSRIADIQVFEVVGNSQGVEISPGGMRFFNSDGDMLISIGTFSDDLLSISKKNSLGQAVTVASIDENGDAAFQNIEISEDAVFQGSPLVGGFADSQTNGVDLTDVAMLDRLGRGAIAVGRIGVGGWEDVNHVRAALASFPVELRAGRVYQFQFQGNMVAEWTGGSGIGNLSMQIHWSTETQSITDPKTAGGGWTHARILNTGQENGLDSLSSYIPFREFYVEADGVYNVLVSLSNVSGRSFSFFPGDWDQNPPRISVVDLMPLEAWSFDNWANRDFVRGDTTSPGSTPPVAPKTVTRVWNATWSVLWGPSGSVRPSGGSLYDDGRMLQGGGSSIGSGRAGRVGFPALGLSGRTIKAAWIRVRIRHTGNSAGSTLKIGTHGNTEEPSGSSPNLVNQFSKTVQKGQTVWIKIPPSLYPALASGAIRGFQFGGPNVNSGKSDYVILDGYPSSNAASSSATRPQLKITYQ